MNTTSLTGKFITGLVQLSWVPWHHTFGEEDFLQSGHPSGYPNIGTKGLMDNVNNK